jgi:hypothetical protein
MIIFLLQDKLLSKLEENEPEMASSQEDEVINLNKIKIKCKYNKFQCYINGYLNNV